MFGECLETQNTCNNNVGLIIKVKQLRYNVLVYCILYKLKRLVIQSYALPDITYLVLYFIINTKS